MAMVEVARSSVQTWECDTMGHMNVQFYVEKASQGLAALGLYMGFGPKELGRRDLRFETRDHHIRFLREQRPGAPYYLMAGVLDADDDMFRVLIEMRNTVTDEVAATVVGDVGVVTAIDGRQASLPGSLLKAAERMRVELPNHAAPRGLTLEAPRPTPRLSEAEELGMIATYQGEVRPAQLDAWARLSPRHFMGIVSDSIPNLLARTRGEDRSADQTVGGAALEYRFVYRDFPRGGDLLTLRSGLKQVSPKTYSWVHWLFDLESRQAVATAEAVAVALDLTTRKVIPIPDDMRADLESKLIKGIGV